MFDLFKWFKRTTKQPQQPQEIQRINVYFLDVNAGRVYGFTSPFHKSPKVGTLFFQKMCSGKEAIYRIDKIKYCDDPQDMFFATVSYVRYADERHPLL